MAKALLEQYRISDFLEWNSRKQLKLNPHFQRGSVWTAPARVFLIDTILRELPVPKVYLRTQIDPRTKTSYREVVDGQQRLKAIIDFADDELRLTKRAGEFAGLKYSTLSEDLQSIFLSYPIAVDQLINATDDDVLEVFARLNSYTVSLNDPEKRHARYQGGFKWAVRAASREWSPLFDHIALFGIRDKVRMLDDSLVAEMFMVLIDGVTDGGQPKITAFYKRTDPTFADDDPSVQSLRDTLTFIADHFFDVIAETNLARPPHFLMLFATVAHALHGVPVGQMNGQLPQRENALVDLAMARENLRALDSLIASEVPVSGTEDFWRAAQSSTQRIGSRRVRFATTFRALLPHPLLN